MRISETLLPQIVYNDWLKIIIIFTVFFAIGILLIPNVFAESPNALGKTIKIYNDKICIEDYCGDGDKLRIILEGNVGMMTDKAISLKVKYCQTQMLATACLDNKWLTIAETSTENLGGGSFSGDIMIKQNFLEREYHVIGVVDNVETGRVGLTMMEIINGENEKTGGFFVEWPDDNEVEFASSADSDYGTMRFYVFNPNGDVVHELSINAKPLEIGISQDDEDYEASSFNLKPTFETTQGFTIAGGSEFLTAKSTFDSSDNTCSVESKQISQKKITTTMTYIDEFRYAVYLEGVERQSWDISRQMFDEDRNPIYPLYKITSDLSPMFITLDIPTNSLGKYEVFLTQQAYGSELYNYPWKIDQIMDSEITKKSQLNKRNAVLVCTFEIIPPEQKLPTWIKNNAEWWAAGQIDDTSFLTGIKFLIENNIIILPDTTKSAESSQETIPEWVKNNAGWWAQGAITEDDFIIGLQFLVENGIINVN